MKTAWWSFIVCWEGLGAGGEGDDRGWDGWMASLTWSTRVWVNSGSWWWTGRPGMLQFMGSQRVGHDWVTELNWTELNWILIKQGYVDTETSTHREKTMWKIQGEDSHVSDMRYSWLLNHTVLNWVGLLICGFLSINTCSAPLSVAGWICRCRTTDSVFICLFIFCWILVYPWLLETILLGYQGTTVHAS